MHGYSEVPQHLGNQGIVRVECGTRTQLNGFPQLFKEVFRGRGELGEPDFSLRSLRIKDVGSQMAAGAVAINANYRTYINLNRQSLYPGTSCTSGSGKSGAKVRKHCREGLRLYNSFMNALKEWGVAEADRQAVEMLPLGPLKLKEISQAARQSDTQHINARRAYAEHIANCLVCSRHLVTA